MTETTLQIAPPELVKQARDANDLSQVTYNYFQKGLKLIRQIEGVKSSFRKRTTWGILLIILVSLIIIGILEYAYYAEREVLKVGEGQQYATIQSAVDAAEDGNVILVYPDTYTESVDATSKTVVIKGVDKETCILTYPNGDYDNPPLEMASGILKNMTIKATAQEKIDGAVAKAYCLHTDYDILTRKTFYIENVDFINADYQAVGIGLRGKSTLEFVNCTFTCEGENNAFYCHNDTQPATNQNLIVKNCIFTNNGSGYTILMQTQEQEGSSVYATWQGNTVINNGDSNALICMSFYNPSIGGGGWLGSTDWILTPDSVLNNIDELNYSIV